MFDKSLRIYYRRAREPNHDQTTSKTPKRLRSKTYIILRGLSSPALYPESFLQSLKIRRKQKASPIAKMTPIMKSTADPIPKGCHNTPVNQQATSVTKRKRNITPRTMSSLMKVPLCSSNLPSNPNSQTRANTPTSNQTPNKTRLAENARDKNNPTEPRPPRSTSVPCHTKATKTLSKIPTTLLLLVLNLFILSDLLKSK